MARYVSRGLAELVDLKRPEDKLVINNPKMFIRRDDWEGDDPAWVGKSISEVPISELIKLNEEEGTEYPVSGSDLAKLRGKTLEPDIISFDRHGTVVSDRAHHPDRVVDHRLRHPKRT